MKTKINIGIGLLVAGLLILVGLYSAPLFHWHDLGATLSLGMAAATLTPEQEAMKTDILNSIKTQVEGQLSTRMKKEDVDNEIKAALKQFEGIELDALRKMLKADDGVMAMLVAQGAEITALKETAGKREDANLSVRAQIEAWQTKHKDLIKRVKHNHEKLDIPALELRVASPMTPANTYNGSSYLPNITYEPGIHDIRRVQPTFWDYLRKGRTAYATYVWVNKLNPLGAAAFIGPGVAKPGVSFEIQTETSNAKKIAASEKVAIELLDDIDGMTSWVTGELFYQTMKKVNTTLMTGTLSSTVPAGIQTISVAFTQTGLSTDNPNNFDAIRAIVAQLRVGFFLGASDGPVVVFINPVDAANMDMTKSTDSGVYLLPPFSTADGKTVAGATIVEDNNIQIGYVQAAMIDLFKVLIYKDFSITWGWENDDFTKNLVTVIGEMRLHSFHSDADAGAFIYDSFTDIKAAIAAS